MKNLVLIGIGLLAGIYAVVGAIQFVKSLLNSDSGTAYGAANIAAAAVPICIGLIVCAACFQRVLRGPKS